MGRSKSLARGVAAAAKPGESALDHPLLGQEPKAFNTGRMPDNFVAGIYIVHLATVVADVLWGGHHFIASVFLSDLRKSWAEAAYNFSFDSVGKIS